MFFTSTIGVATCALGRVDVQVDVGVDPQAPFLHVAVGNAEVGQQQLQFGQIGLRLGRRAQVGLADDLQQRRARAVQVDAAVGLAGHFVVHALAGVFFEMGPDDADLLRLEAILGVADRQVAVVRQRQVVLADLVALGQVRVVVLLAVPLGEAGDLAVQRHGRSQAPVRKPRRFITGSVPGMPMQTGQVCVLGGAELRATAAEQLACASATARELPGR